MVSSPEGRHVLDLFDHLSPERVDAILDALPASTREHLASLSPSTRIDRLKSKRYVMHGVRDCHIPITQGRRLAAEAPPGTVRRYTELHLFEHVRPDQELSSIATSVELVKLYHHLWLVAQEVL